MDYPNCNLQTLCTFCIPIYLKYCESDKISDSPVKSYLLPPVIIYQGIDHPVNLMYKSV